MQNIFETETEVQVNNRRSTLNPKVNNIPIRFRRGSTKKLDEKNEIEEILNQIVPFNKGISRDSAYNP